MADSYYLSMFGGLQLWISRLSTDKSRSQVRHELTAGDDYVVQDRGRVLFVTSATLLFDWMDGDNISPLDRIRKLSALVDDQPRIMSHPVEGSFLARVGPFKYDIDENGVITANVEFVAVSDVTAVAPVSAGTLAGPGAGLVSASAQELIDELQDSDLTSPNADNAAATVQAWDDDEPSPREILTQTGSLTSDLGAEADNYDSDVNLWSAFKATVILAETIRMAAQAQTADTAQTFLLRVGTPIALRSLLAANYPADEADARYDEIIALNDIASPWSIDLGTELLMPMPAILPRAA